MMRIVSGGALALAIAWTGTAPAMAQSAVTSNVQISYEVPSNNAFRPVYDRLRQRQVLERLQKFLSPLRLPRTLTVRTAQCGAVSLPYQPTPVVTLCYEFVAQVEKQAPPANDVNIIGAAFVTRNMAIVGPIVHSLLHDVSRTVFDILEIPVWGNAVDAADHVAAFLMLQFGPDVAQKTIFGTALYLAKANETLDPQNVNPHVTQRYYNILCMAVGHDLVRYASFIPLKRPEQPGDLPMHRVGRCASLEPSEYTEYGKVRVAFAALFLENHIDEELMREIQGTDWLKED
jgi:hypothetical protein